MAITLVITQRDRQIVFLDPSDETANNHPNRLLQRAKPVGTRYRKLALGRGKFLHCVSSLSMAPADIIRIHTTEFTPLLQPETCLRHYPTLKTYTGAQNIDNLQSILP